ncbi:MAG: S8 family serine peptidase, partial [Woeseiaceae bacterium]|nr:S8 family serine peptidase [Woeseiaceae bacterium]
TGGEHRYIVQFDDEPLPLYDGGIVGLSPASLVGGKLNTSSSAARAYVAHLQRKQADMVSDMNATAGGITVERTHQHALNAVTVRMTEAAANKVRNLPGVRLVERDRAVPLNTATSVPFIGADQLWDGSATGGVPFQGEGMVVGIIDSGINHEHPSFADVGADGYDHTNPLGSGVYLGECATIPGLCNDKLIGAYTFLDAQDSTPPDEILIPGDPPSTDTDGHGTHVASTAAGNILAGVALPDADGNPGSIVFPQISGVAPHANVVAFKVCAPSCFFSDIVAAVDQAIADGVVDVLNHSIGSPGGSPWTSSQAQAFLAARAAGIFVANSAGNSGPGAGTAEAAGNAPWVAGVAATTHDRAFPPKLLMNLSGGASAPPADIPGRSVSGGITGEIVYAADFPTSNGSANDTQPEQCLDPFPAGTFTANQIVLCDRGAIARVAKGQNVRDGGAGGFILGNLAGGATSVNDDPHVIPAIHINSANADALRGWLSTGSGHTGTITPVDAPVTDPAAGDVVAGFSSRGPYTGFDILAPNTAAPGVSILAAGAELTPAQVDLIGVLYAGTPSEFPSVPGQYGQIGGTSMASPHIAGTAALIKQANPDWTDAEVLSAIMTTGSYDLRKEDGVTPADLHDIGGGRVQVAQAVNATLVLDETAANFEAADPELGGDPASLNVAGLVQDECVLACTWTRTVRATVAGTWTTSGFDPWVSVSPASFSLAAGETQVIEITADAAALPANVWSFSRAVLTPATAGSPPSQLPIAVVPAFGELPESVDILASRDAGSQLVTDVTAAVVNGFNVRIFEPAKVEGMSFALPGDSDNSSPYDNLSDGVAVVLHDAPAGTQRVRFEVLSSESPDLDLFVGVVIGGTPIFDPGFEVCVSATATALESCDLDADFLQLLRDIIGTDELSFYAVIQNWAPSAPAAVDAFEFAATNVSNLPATSVHAEGPVGSLPPLEPFDVRFFWDLPSETGDRFLSTTEWYGDAAQTTLLGKVPLQILRGTDDVVMTSNATGPVDVGEPVTFSAVVQPNFTLEDRTYDVSVPVPFGLDVDPATISDGGVMKGRWITWNVTQESLVGQEGTYNVSTNADDLSCDTPFGGYVNLADFGIGPQPGLVGDSFAATAFGGQNPIEFYGQLRTGGITFTDDGFGFFDSTPGFLPFINLPIPTPDDPNDMLAPFWFDWIVEFDGERGITLANAGPNISVIEWDGVEPWTPDASAPPLADFQLFMWMPVDPSGPEFIFAFDNLDPGLVSVLAGDPSIVTTGVENRTGTAGTEYTGEYFDNLIVCFDYEGPDTSPRALSFTATPRPFTHGRSIKVKEFDHVDNPGSRLAASSTEIEVNQLPYRFDGFFGLKDGQKIDSDRRKVRVAFRLYDPVIWWLPIIDADASVEVTDAGGNVVASGDANWTWRGWRYEFTWRPHGLPEGNYTITAYLDDGTSHSVTVELVDD